MKNIQKRFNSVTIIFCSIFALLACSNTSPVQTTLFADNKNISVMGRTVSSESGSVRFSYPGVTFSMIVEAKALSINVQSTQGNSYIDVTIDQQKPRPIKVSKNNQDIEIFSSDNAVRHHIVIQHRSESWHGTTTINHLNIKEGYLLPAPNLPKQKLLFIGDSITCGDAIDRPIPLPKEQCNKSNAWWNAKQTFGMLLSEKLNAQAQLICYGGRGVIRTWEGKTDDLNAEHYYEMAIPELKGKNLWDHNNYQANVAVIALGTNDFSGAAGPFPEQQHFVESYIRLIKKLQNDHPNIKIAITDGPMLSGEAKSTLRSYLSDIVKAFNNNDVSLILAEHKPGDSCDYHPNRDIHKSIADEFYPLLNALLNN